MHGILEHSLVHLGGSAQACGTLVVEEDVHIVIGSALEPSCRMQVSR